MQTPLAPAPEVEIPEEAVPLAPAPGPAPEEELDLAEEAVPLGNLPQTGGSVRDNALRASLALAALSAAGLCAALLLGREKRA